MDEKTIEYVLLLCANAEIGRTKAMFYLGVSYAELLRLMSSRGAAVPELDQAQIDDMATTFVKFHDERRNRLMILIPDGGPIIRLALAKRLDTLLALQQPLHVIDQVRWEMTRDEAREDARLIAEFMRDHPNDVRELVTKVGIAARAEREANPGASQKGLTIRAIDEVLDQLGKMTDEHGPILLLYEDWDVRRFSRNIAGDVHLLSTRALLVGMERRGLIPSADEIWSSLPPGPSSQPAAAAAPNS